MENINKNILSTLLPDDPSESKQNKLTGKSTNNLLPSCTNLNATNANKGGYIHYDKCYNTIRRGWRSQGRGDKKGDKEGDEEQEEQGGCDKCNEDKYGATL